jgi:hypothetical protein
VIIVCSSRPIPDDMIEAARDEGVAILRTAESQFVVSGRLYALWGTRLRPERGGAMAILADLHNHSCLSPCGSLELSPRVLASRAGPPASVSLPSRTITPRAIAPPSPRPQEVGILPVSHGGDHQGGGAHPLPLRGPGRGPGFSEAAYALLPAFPNDPERLGDQVWVDADENVKARSRITSA